MESTNLTSLTCLATRATGKVSPALTIVKVQGNQVLAGDPEVVERAAFA